MASGFLDNISGIGESGKEIKDWAPSRPLCTYMRNNTIHAENGSIITVYLGKISYIMSASSSEGAKVGSATEEVEKRACRCKFCGEMLILSSEDEAVAHMRVCPAMQEQLQGSGPFTIPKDVQAQMNRSDEKKDS